jgi:hypothetical protein
MRNVRLQHGIGCLGGVAGLSFGCRSSSLSRQEAGFSF